MTLTRTTLALALGLLLAAAGCDAGLGIGTGTRCAGEMQGIRLRHGQPDRVEEAPDARSQFWFYNAERITYEFSWDQEGENCSVRSARFVHVPSGG